jgi:phosphatidylglycerol lysyltransferase
VKGKLVRRLGPIVALVLFVMALYILRGAMKRYHYRDIVRYIRQVHYTRVLVAVGLTVVNYIVMTFYDTLAFRYLGRRVAYHRIALGSFLGYVFSLNFAMPVLGASAARYRVYSSWGISALETAKVVVFSGMTFIIGFLTIAGVVFLVEPTPIPSASRLPSSLIHPLAIVLLALVVGYVLATVWRKKPLKIRRWEFRFPSLQVSLAQIAVSCLDWALAASVLYTLLPSGQNLSFPKVLAVFLLAESAGLLSQVPGGLGVLEGMVLLLLSPPLPASGVLGAVLVYRAIYYLFPFAIGVGLLAVREILQNRKAFQRFAKAFGQWASFFVPRGLSITTFVAGAILLFSGALPPEESRMDWLTDLLPLPAIEISHFLGSLAGAGLLLVAWNLGRRLRGAYILSSVLLGAGVLSSLARGLQYKEALILSLMLAALLPCRRHFYRKGSLSAQRLSVPWLAAVVGVLLSSIWLGLFSFKHVEYSNELWWRFTLTGNASRFLRASAGASSVILLFSLAKLLRPVPPRPSSPGPLELDRAYALVAQSTQSSANLALLGDKAFLFSASGNAFIMYGIEGRSWIALGDPVGPADEWRELIWEFHEMSDRYGGWTVFYEVGKERLPLYLDIGLTLLKLGEEARVPLEQFSLEGAARKELRHDHRKAADAGYAFEVIPPEAVPASLGELRVVSDSWLASKNTPEKGFSLGYFDEAYLSRFSAGIVRREGRIVAFANIWQGAEKEELSIDLMRYLPGAVHGLMDFLLVELMLWGKQRGYRWFNLGISPFSGLESRIAAPPWNRLGAFVFRHGEHFYNFQGLRHYKDKFDPVWSPRYLASHGGLALPRVLRNLISLISRGPGGIIHE